MMSIRGKLLTAIRAHAEGHIAKHKANLEVYLENPAGIGEHSDVLEAMEKEIEMIAKYEDHLEVLKKHYK